MTAEHAHGDDSGYDDERCYGQDTTHLVEILLQRCLAGFDRLQHLGDPAELGLHAGADDDSTASPIGGDGSAKNHVVAVTKGQVLRAERFRVLGDRYRFARQRGFIDLQVDRLEQSRIRCHFVSRVQ